MNCPAGLSGYHSYEAKVGKNTSSNIMTISIPEGLPRFEGEKVMIAVCGGLSARVLKGEDGELSEIFSLRAPEIHYSDREMSFVSNSKGERLGSGGVMEQVDEKEKREFLSEFERLMAKELADAKFDRIYVLVPEYAAKEVLDVIPGAMAPRTVVAAYGNYLDQPDTKILRYIAESGY